MNAVIDRYRGLQNPQRAERKVELLVVGLVLILALQILWGGFRLAFPALPAAVSPTPDSLAVGRISGLGVVAEEQRAEIRSRPLFWQSRRQAEQIGLTEVTTSAEQHNSAPEKIRGVTLTGVFGGGESAGIIVVAGGKENRLVIGDELKGWRLDSVTATGAVFKSGGRTSELELRPATIELDIVEQGAASPNTSPEAQVEPQVPRKKPGADSRPPSGGLSLGGRPRGKRQGK